jgi:hypothetical protein
MKKIALFVIGLVFSAGMLAAQDAEAIVKASRNRIKADTVSTRSRMVITAKNGSTTDRVIDEYSKDDAKGNGRTVIVFQSPATVRGTRFLTIEKPAQADDRWISLPNLKGGEPRRIAASEGSGSFMGTDLSYDDISSLDREPNLDTHTFLREEILGVNTCYVIQSIPRDKSYQYSKMLSWIDKSSSVTYKVELYKKDALFKILETSNFQNIQNRLTALQTKMTTVDAGTSTTVIVEKLVYDAFIPEKVFTPGFLETGKAD